MKRLTAAFILFLLLAASTTATAASVSNCKEAMSKFRELGNVPEMLAESYGYAVLPTIGKGGMGIGGAGGSGCVFAGGKHTGCLLYTSDAADDRTCVLVGGGGGGG